MVCLGVGVVMVVCLLRVDCVCMVFLWWCCGLWFVGYG